MGEILESKRVVFVTVGTTCFDSLVRAVDTDQVRQALLKKGYTHLLIQMGRGTYIPTKHAGDDGSLSVDYFTFSSSIAEYLKSADLVISHAAFRDMPFTLREAAPLSNTTFVPQRFAPLVNSARVICGQPTCTVDQRCKSLRDGGSGSIFESLRLRKPLIVVVNEDLMDNHQAELAEELADRKHLFCARPQSLYETISAMDLDSLVAYQPGDATPVAKFINRFLGFTED